MWADIVIKDLGPISHTSQSSSMENMEVSVMTERDFGPNHYFTSSVTVSFINAEFVVSSALFPSDLQTL